MSIEQEAIKKMEKVLMSWFIADPAMLGAFTLVNKQADPRQNTIGIDSRSNPVTIRFNPKFINMLNFEQLEHIMASEGLKILLRHATTRHKDPKHISSLSSVITVNEVANKFIAELLDMDKDLPTAKKFGLEPQQYFEEYFRNLLEKQEEVDQQLQQMFGQAPQQGEGEGQQSGGPGKGSPEDGEGEPSEGEGEGGGQDFKDFKSPGEAIKDYMNPMSTGSQDWGKNELFDAEVQNMVNEKKDSAKEWGKYTGDAMQSIIAANTPKCDWRTILRRFHNTVVSEKTFTSRMKVNRRYDLAAPGHRREYKSKVLFAVDVSGSMSDREISEAFAIINNVCRKSKLTFLLFDTDIKLVEKNFKKARSTFKVVGRGGTDINKVFRYAEENKFDGHVIFTDGEMETAVPPKTGKLLWLLTSPDKKPPIPQGYVAHIRE